MLLKCFCLRTLESIVRSLWAGGHMEMLGQGLLRRGTEAPYPFPIPCPVHLSHLAVPGLYPFIINQ